MVSIWIDGVQNGKFDLAFTIIIKTGKFLFLRQEEYNIV